MEIGINKTDIFNNVNEETSMKKFLGCLLSVTLIQGSIQASSWVSPKAWSYWYNGKTDDVRDAAKEAWFRCESTADAFKAFVKKTQVDGTFVTDAYLKSDLLNAYNVGGEDTRLHMLVREQGMALNLEAVQALVDLGVDINRVNKAGTSPLLLLLQLNNISHADLGGTIAGLTNLGANPAASTRSGKTALHILAAPSKKDQVFDREMIKWWVANNVNPHAVDSNGNTVLHTLALRGSLTENIDTYEYLIHDLKVDQHLVNNKGQTFAHILEAKCFKGEDSEEMIARVNALVASGLLLKDKAVVIDPDDGKKTTVDPKDPKVIVANNKRRNLLFGLGGAAVLGTLYYVYTSNQKSRPGTAVAA